MRVIAALRTSVWRPCSSPKQIQSLNEPGAVYVMPASDQADQFGGVLS
jgi:hypothetical protein